MAKRNIFRGLAAVLALGMCMTGLAGCGNEKRADGKTEIEVVSYKPEAVKAFEKIEKRFNETHDDIHLTISSPNEAMTILKTRFIREDYPDIIAIGGDINYSNFLDADLFDDISDLDEVQTIKQAYLDMDKELEFIPKDGTYALPYVANAAGILYNKDLFEENGWKVPTHVHTNDPGLAIQKALTHGSLTKIKIDNMREEHQEKLIKDAEKAAARQKEQEAEKEEPRKPMGFIAVSIGEGMNEIFRGLGADYLIEGGQTMNPSTEDMLAAIDHVNADHIFILPNNKNIIMAANQAAELTEDKDIIVLPTKTIPQGIVALVNYIPDYTAEENKEAMLAELDSVKTGQVTYAVRDTEIDGMQIRQNDYMGIGDKAILAVGTDLKETTMKMIDAMVDEDSAIVSIYYGADETEEHAQEIGKMIEEKYPDVEVEINCGGQPIYYFVISVE